MTKILNWANTNPKKLFILDASGAMLSAFFLGVVLTQLEPYFGIPIPTLYLLASIPCFFAVYDFVCYFRLKNSLESFLKVIAISNLLYCLLSIGLAFYHRASINTLGWFYIIVEVVIVVIIGWLELRVARHLSKQS
jgi:lysylphosphatidylglycerol synthetase-like protein (DUF2156 family)